MNEACLFQFDILSGFSMAPSEVEYFIQLHGGAYARIIFILSSKFEKKTDLQVCVKGAKNS